MFYTCIYKEGKSCCSYQGQLNITRLDHHFVEFTLEGRGSTFYAAVGHNSHGSYLCIPMLYIGCELSRLNDEFWNRERISRFLNEIDTLTVVKGLTALQPFVDFE